jgi:outer membrane putative beta-barrel porin/alpha-amylase
LNSARKDQVMTLPFYGAALTAACLLCLSQSAHAQYDASKWREIETKYIFGFTEGSGIGLEGEKEFSIDTEARIGKSGGKYWGSETKLEYEFTPNQYVQFEFGPFLSAHKISCVDGLDDRSRGDLGGFFGEIRTIILDRGPNSPLAVTFSAEPEWRRIDETSGERVNNFELELKVNADLELIAKQLYLGFNLLYEPEATHDPDRIGAGWMTESKAGVSAALSYRIVQSVFVGVEAWYLRHYDGTWLNNFTGDAWFVGPTLYAQINKKMFISAAWNAQVSGRDVDDPTAKFNTAEFTRHRAKLKFAVEF